MILGRKRRRAALEAHKRLVRGDIAIAPFDVDDLYEPNPGSHATTIEDAWGEHGHWVKPPNPAYVDIGDGLTDRPKP